jgi:TonB family protein
MTAEAILSNLPSWLAQLLVIASLGALLPLVFRIRHARSHLFYCHLLLALCLLLPLVQPWRHATVVVHDPATAAARPNNPPSLAIGSSLPITWAISWNRILLWMLFSGIGARLIWLGSGLQQIRRYRLAAVPLQAIPQSIVDARSKVKADAFFCISPSVAGPVTLGFWRPVILLPDKFFSLPEEAQCGIACHELLHVQRRDWLVMMIEEIAGTLFWFHPAIWFVLSQARLARERLVDAEVVRITAAPESYIHALLAIAGVRPAADLAPAPLFLRRRHLMQRMHSLLTEVSMSKFRLVSSYASMAAILALVGWSASVAFPLIGRAEVRQITQEPSRPAANAPGYLVNRAPISYPPEALRKRIEGTVVVELTFNATGQIVDSRVLSGAEELRQSALQTALQGSYSIDVARTLQVVVDYKLPPAGQRGPAPRTAASPVAAPGDKNTFAEVSGRVMDPSRNLLPGVTMTFTDPVTGRVSVLNTNATGEYRIATLLPGTYRLSAELPGFKTVTYNSVPLAPSQQVRLNFTLEPETGTSQGATAPPPPPPPSSLPRVRVGGNVAAGNLIQQTKPVFPQEAKDNRIQGVVVLEAEINTEGAVTNLRVISGQPVFIQPAIDAVKQWVYKPVMLNGQPVDVVTTVTINFALTD